MHLHTNHSDGTDSPARVIERARECGLYAVAITDHDTVSALDEAEQAARAMGIEFLAAVEISATHGRSEVHVLGLGIHRDDAALCSTLDRMRAGRADRVRRIIEKLAARGVAISYEEVAAMSACEGALGRMHIARVMHNRGTVNTVQAAFDQFLGEGKSAFVPKPRLSCAQAIEVIHNAGGLAFLAHPGIGAPRRDLDRFLRLPFDGIEAYHTKHSPGLTDALVQIAAERRLLVTGGSDCHGEAKSPPEMGKVRLPIVYYERIVDALRSQT